ncbi:uncharacterized protein [Littorina saxatilis]|uniref:uncharacterized protein isoform X2 n=1 Tax=Littorina saxatilis TaxID=31220 RepID=UPI0038B52318
MSCLLVVLSALVAGAVGYIQLQPVDYAQLQDRAGGLTLNASTSNRLAWDDGTNTLYVLAKEPARLTVFSLSFTGMLNEIANIDLTSGARDTVGEPNHVEFCRPATPGNTARLAISYDDPEDPSQPGTVRLYQAMSQANPTLTQIIGFSVGANPVDMEFGLDCLRLLVANAGRPYMKLAAVNDPPGTISKVDMPGVLDTTSSPTITTIGFALLLENPDGTDNTANLAPLMTKQFRRTPIRDNNNDVLKVTQNMEPVSIVIAPNGQTAYVAMPKNNAIGRLNMDLDIVSEIFPLGRRSWGEFYMDASKADNAVHLENYRLYSTLQPKQVKWVVANETAWLITLDTGFLDTIPEYGYTDYDTGMNLMSSGVITGADAVMQAKLLDDTRLGQAHISTVDGRDPSGANIEDIYMFGGRGISIHDGQTLDLRTSLVDNLERVSAQFYKEVFNSAFTSPTNTPQMDRDVTSPTTGPNLSVMETGIFEKVKVMLLGSRTSVMIFVCNSTELHID